MNATTAATSASGIAAARAAVAEHVPGRKPPPVELGPSQERWLAWRLDPPKAPPRVDAWVVSLDPRIRRDRMAEAVAEVVARRDELRSCFPGEGAGLAADGNAARLTDRAGPTAEDDWPVWIVSAVRETLEVERGPLAGLWWVSGGQSIHLVVALHDLAGGAAGARAVLEDLAAAYTPDAGVVPAHRDYQVRRPADRRAMADGDGATDRGRSTKAPPEPMEIPPDRSRPPVPSFESQAVRADLPADVVGGIQRLAGQIGTSGEDAWLAAVLAWVQRLTGSEAPWLGCPADRHGAGWYPLAVDGVAARPFSNLVRAVAHERAAGAESDGRAILARARDPHGQRDTARPWPCDVTVELEPLHFELRFGEHLCVARRVSRSHQESDLALTIDAASTEAAIELRGNRDVLTRDTLQRWLGHLCVLIEAAQRSPETQVDRLDLLTSAEWELLVRGWNPAPMPSCAHPGVLHQLLAGVFVKRADHAAVIADDVVLTFGALEKRSNQLAHSLIAQGVRPRSRVGLALPRCADYAVATLAVLKAGAAFVPIDLEWPEERKEFVVRDCEAVLVLHAGSPAVPQAGTGAVREVHVAAMMALAAACPAERPAVEVRADDLAYVIYTSGTTGRPKGVMIDHRALCAHLQSIAQVYGLQPDDRGLLFHSVAFDPAIEQLFSPLLVGATVCVRGRGLWTGREFSEFVRREGITAVTLPPRYWLEIMREWEREPSLSLAGQLRRVLVGGEPLPLAVVDLWRRLGLTSIRLLNGYGPTECTVTATVHELPRERDVGEACGRVPIGRPHGPVEAYVLDPGLQPQPIGVAGELCLAGPTLARGYLGAEALTRERFVPHPFRSGERLYRTGDRVRWLADGTIEFCGRTDRQVKVGGYRIEPGEIEAVLCGIDGIESCAVIPDTSARQETILCAYAVAEPGKEAQVAGWRERARAALPGYMVPSELFLVPSLPRTINGKLDTGALARLGAEMRAKAPPRRSSGRDGARAPAEFEGEIAPRIAASWCDLLGQTDVAPEDDFFDAGGHSLLAIALYARLEGEFGARLALREWLGEPTFGALVRLVASAGGGSRHAATESHPRWRFLFPIRATGTRPRIFLLAGGRGCDEDFVVLTGLARELGPDQPVWGLRVGGPDRLHPWHDDAWDMAEEVATEIRTFQPDGPYLLVGECIGGLLAFEVARVLERSGASVDFVALINTGCPRPGESMRWWLRTSWVGRARRELPRLLAAWKGGGWRGAAGELVPAWSRIARPPSSSRPRRDDGMPDDPKDYFYGRMLLRYRPTPARLPLTLVACETHLRGADPRRWSEFALRGFSVVPVPGDTSSCLREHAAQTALGLRRALHAQHG